MSEMEILPVTHTPQNPDHLPLHRSLRILLFLCAIGMIAVSGYLVFHYYEAYFPTQLEQASFCNRSSFWNCDLAVFSPLSNFFHIPISALGILLGGWVVGAVLLSRRTWLQTVYGFVILNAIGCLGLLVYSLFYLNGLCPGCTLYYGLSWIVLFLLWFAAVPVAVPSLFPSAVLGLSAVALLTGFHLYNKERFAKQSETSRTFVEKLQASALFPEDAIETGYYLAGSKETFHQMPLRVIVFSDFQCPVCRIFSEMVPRILKRYQEKIAIQYVFYPLDSHCNPQMQHPGHPQACAASYIAYCSPTRFHAVHDTLYQAQGEFTDSFFDQMALSSHIEDCYRSESTKAAISEMIAKSATYAIEATPTLIINGKKLDGVLPLSYLFEIFDALIAATSPVSIVPPAAAPTSAPAVAVPVTTP